MRVGLSFGIGPLRFYQPLNKRRQRKPRPAGTRPYLVHDGCKLRHVSERTLAQCAAKKGLSAQGRVGGYF